MDIVVEGLVKQFQADRDLDALAPDEAFEPSTSRAGSRRRSGPSATT
ncbi:hypothetical protein JIG36_09755 [Actinoplanes sp. LDG1-06]|uniref:Uncharacterized protein n=1 Tax=Paractinoplanes ovalisporus TaxID=2810368 RepID=A0ABS2A7M1_9ACTN|nr:hypothetical protein [Actinoplanes ovalisporus]MBM2615839.1 hypothetical protein [Actinoplanes ovalisporus]